MRRVNSREAREDDEIALLVPVQQTVVALEEAHRRMETINGEKSAADLVKITAARLGRTFNGSFPPIYQCAYMLGTLQFYALHKELVDSKR